MTAAQHKLEILQSLNRLDAVQSERVLDYIKGLLYSPAANLQRQHVRRKAMKEIGQALQEMRRRD